MSAIEERLRRAAAELDEVPPRRNGAVTKKGLLPSPAPAPDAPKTDMARWLSAALGIEADPLASVARYGRHEDARMVLLQRSGQRVTFDRQGDVFNPDKLVRTVTLHTGAN